MQTAKRRRTTWAVAASLIAHIAVLTVVVRQHPMLAIPQEAAGPPEPIIPILLMPRVPPAGAAHGGPSEIRLHRRALRTAPKDLPVAPLIIPAAPPVAAPAPVQAVAARPAAPSAADIQQTNVRGALQGLLGCANPETAKLTAAQRAKCDERLAAGARDTTFLGLGVSRDKQRQLDAAGARKDADYRYKRSLGPAGPGGAGGDSGQPSQIPSFEQPPLGRLPP